MTESDRAKDREQLLREHVQLVVDEAPPLSEEQRVKLAALLRGATSPTNRQGG